MASYQIDYADTFGNVTTQIFYGTQDELESELDSMYAQGISDLIVRNAF